MASYTIAIAAYERALALVAQRAGIPAPVPPDKKDLLDQAEQLALPGIGQTTESTLRPLRSILGRLQDQNKLGYYRLAEISISAWNTLGESPILPVDEKPIIQASDYAALWQQLEKEASRFTAVAQSEQVREANLLALLQRFCWAIPAPVAQQEKEMIDDVSLYDFTRVSAALAVCLQDRSTATSSGEPVALLIGGDLSGVQDWLYTLSSEGAARNLRGRSFYLQLLSEVIALYVLSELGLPSCNLLYAGGGNFYLLAPPTCSGRIPEIQQEISNRLLTMHEGALYVALGQMPMNAQELTNGQVDAVWHGVSSAIGRVKAKRFAELDDEKMAVAIGTPQSGSDDPLNTCAVCRRVISKEESTDELNNGGRKCQLCGSLESLGQELRFAEFLVISTITPKPLHRVNSWQASLAHFGYDVQLCWSQKLPRWQPVSSDLVRVFFWEKKNGFPGTLPLARTVWSFRPLAQCIPIDADQDRVADFDKLQAKGIQRWGALRMDVDNLGAIFQHGLPSGNLCRVVSLSGLLRLFFEGHVPALAQRMNQQAENRALYLMYAGGDDLFVVGGWSHLPELAADIRRELGKFACGNPKVTISGGVSIALADKYPLYQAARDAGEAEDLAKELEGKDGLAFLGQAVKWGEEYEQVSKRVADLQRWLSNEQQPGLPRSFLMTLRQIDAEWRAWKKQEQSIQAYYKHTDKKLFVGPWVWHMIYQLGRAGERCKNNQLKAEINRFIQIILEKEIYTLGLVARWVELLKRDGG